MGFREYLCETLDVEKKTIKDVMEELFGADNFVVNGGHGWEVEYNVRLDQLKTPHEFRQRVKDPKERAEIMNGAKESLKEKKRIAKNVLDRYKKDKTKTLDQHRQNFHRDEEPLTYIEQMKLLRGEKIGRKGM